MAERRRNTPTRTQRPPYEVLEFERDIVELETKIGELETLSRSTDLSLNGEIQPLKERLLRKVQDVFRSITPWQQVLVARAPGRPLSTDYIEAMCDDFMELHGDRSFREDRAIITGIGRIGSRRLMVIAHRKGRDTKEKVQCYFGSAHPEGYRKALLRMKLAEKFGLPVLTLINTPGAYPGIGAEERGQAWAIAENLRAMFSLKVPIVCVVIGEGGSGGALGIGIGDRVLVLEHAYYSVISPEGCAAILWNDRKRAPEAAEALKLSSKDLLELGVVDEVLEEPVGAAHRDPEATINLVRERILWHLDELAELPRERLLEERARKFRQMGSLFAAWPPPDPPPPEESPESEGEDS